MSELHSPTTGKIAAALVATQKAMGPALKKTMGQVGSAKKLYADLGSVMEACMEHLSANDIAVLQLPQPCDDGAIVQTTLFHASGEWIKDGGLHIVAAKRDAQAFGSALSYARRYALAAVLGIVQADDDGKGSGTVKADALDPEQYDALVGKLMEVGHARNVAEARAKACPPKDFGRWIAKADKQIAEKVPA